MAPSRAPGRRQAPAGAYEDGRAFYELVSVVFRNEGAVLQIRENTAWHARGIGPGKPLEVVAGRGRVVRLLLLRLLLLRVPAEPAPERGATGPPASPPK